MRRGHRPLGVLVAIAATAALAGPASAATQTDTTALQNAVKVGNDKSGIRSHLKQLQLIADKPGNDGNRATATQGHEDSVAYVKKQLATAGGYWRVSEQPFSADVFEELAPPTLSSTPAASPSWQANVDYATMDASGSGAIAGAPLVSIGFVEPTTTASASAAGCDISTFPASLAGKVALIQRGTCDFGQKAKNAQDRGALGVIIFNEGTIGAPDRNGLINGTIGGYGVTIPTLEATYAAGRFLHDAYVKNQNPTVSMSATTQNRTLVTRNVIAETTTGRTDRTVISGAHLDSVPEGPGINDDGSGTATQIEVALQ